MQNPEQLPAWRDLTRLAATTGCQRIEDLFAGDDQRAQRYSVCAAGVMLDFSKQRIDDTVLQTLAALAEQQGFDAARRALYAGEAINNSEGRAAWHMALRQPDETPLCPAVHEVRAAMAACVDEVRSGRWRGHGGAPIADVVNIGIGGSDLGPRLVCEALAPRRQHIRVHFVANVDPTELDDTLARMDPGRTLFIVTSKSFSTAETLANAEVARQWLLDHGAPPTAIARHFVAVSTNEAAVREFGIERMFDFWDWVGGRFSLWSAVGLSIALALGMDEFDELLAGAHAMDEHFRCAPVLENLPALLGLIGVWNRNFLGLDSHVVVPYAQRLAALPAFLQQLEMESNGKSVMRDGQRCRVATVPAVWGSAGTNAQHAFFQMLHQGDLVTDVDFILPLSMPETVVDARERQRLANCLAQAEALMRGRALDAPAAELAAQGLTGEALRHGLAVRRFDGNRPSSALLFDCLDARSLGALLAAYEHKVFVQGMIWNINSFDQWGVELGKTMAGQLLGELEDSRQPVAHDGSTEALMARVRAAWRS